MFKIGDEVVCTYHNTDSLGQLIIGKTYEILNARLQSLDGTEPATKYIKIIDSALIENWYDASWFSYTEEKLPEGKKDDSKKPDMTDIPLEAMWEMGAAFTYGQKKYGKNNYRKGMVPSRQLAAAVRHIYQHLSGQSIDPESGVTHLGHALASIAMACYTIKHHSNLDDRHPEDIERESK